MTSPETEAAFNAEMHAVDDKHDELIRTARKRYREQVAPFEQEFSAKAEAARMEHRKAAHDLLTKYGLETQR